MTILDSSNSPPSRAPFVMPKPERTGPLRTVSTVGRFDDAPATHGAASGSPGRPLSSAKDVIEHAIRVAQEVIDQQIGSGERILRHLRKAPVSKRRTSPLDAKNAASLTERTVVLTNELGVLMVEALETVAESKTVAEVLTKWLGLGAVLGSRGSRTYDGSEATPSGERVGAFVSSPKPAKVEARAFARLPDDAKVNGLHCVDAPPITQVTYRAAAGEFMVTIDAAQPAGVYSGVIVDGDATQALGTMIATVADP